MSLFQSTFLKIISQKMSVLLLRSWKMIFLSMLLHRNSSRFHFQIFLKVYQLSFFKSHLHFILNITFFFKLQIQISFWTKAYKMLSKMLSSIKLINLLFRYLWDKSSLLHQKRKVRKIIHWKWDYCSCTISKSHILWKMFQFSLYQLLHETFHNYSTNETNSIYSFYAKYSYLYVIEVKFIDKNRSLEKSWKKLTAIERYVFNEFLNHLLIKNEWFSKQFILNDCLFSTLNLFEILLDFIVEIQIKEYFHLKWIYFSNHHFLWNLVLFFASRSKSCFSKTKLKIRDFFFVSEN